MADRGENESEIVPIGNDNLSDANVRSTKELGKDDNSSTGCTNPAQGITSTSTLYVSNLHPRIAEPHLQKLFGNACRIHFVRKPNTRNTGTSYTYAFVQYQSNAAARTAMNKFHGQKLLGKELVVRQASDKNDAVLGNKSCHGAPGKRRESDAVVDERLLKRQKNDVQSKIEAVKKAIADSKRKGGV